MVDQVQAMDTSGQSSSVATTTKSSSTTTSAKSNSVPKGKSKSGRWWKESKQRASSIKRYGRDDAIKKLKDRTERKRVQELSQSLRNEISEKARLERERRAECKKRKEENCKKSEIVQTIKDTRKIKKMKKKQLRFIEKRDTTVVEKT